MIEPLSKLEQKIGIKFKDRDLLAKSLIHKSHNSNDNNEKLEFLGDRVLGLVFAKTLLKIYPNDKEGVKT
jgi:ribonuclease-3